MKTVELTDEEVEVLETYLFRKVCKLEEAGLTDSKCFIVLSSIRRKLVAQDLLEEK